MNKIISLFLLQLLFIKPFFASEPVLATLLSVYSNDMQRFTVANYNFTCESYGVVSLSKLLRQKSINSTCKRSIEKFRKKNPHLYHLSETLFFIQQQYHIDIRNNQCIIYIKGKKTLGEILLERGLARVDQKLSDKVLVSVYRNAQRRAKYHNRGMFGSRVAIDCLAEFIRVK